MRKREEIKSDVRHIRNVPPTNGLILEVMLDIRELITLAMRMGAGKWSFLCELKHRRE